MKNTRRRHAPRVLGIIAMALGLTLFAALAPAQQSRVFVTSEFFSGDLGDLAGADAKCQRLGAAVDGGATWIAWLSTQSVNAKDRLTPGSGPFVRATDTSTVIANDISDLTDGSLQNAILVDETGQAVQRFSTAAGTGEAVWTGTTNQGLVAWVKTHDANDNPIDSNVPNNCRNWTNVQPDVLGVIGGATQTVSWTAASGGFACQSGGSNATNPGARLYCFESFGPARTSASTITVRARGATGTENIKLKVNGVTLATWSNISQTMSNYEYAVTSPLTVDKLIIAYDNDVAGTPMAAEVDYVELGNVRYETESPYTEASGVWTRAAGGCTRGKFQRYRLTCNGWFDYEQARGARLGP